jgi:hypothetical protein
MRMIPKVFTTNAEEPIFDRLGGLVCTSFNRDAGALLHSRYDLVRY